MSTFTPHKANNIAHIWSEPTFQFTPEALYKIQCYVEECDKEIGWLGRVRREGDDFLCDEVFLLHQEVGPAATDITAEGLVALIMEIGIEENDTLRLWGHSHVNMGVSPSPTDRETPEMFRQNGCEFFFRIICNKKGEIGVTFFNWAQNYYIEDMKWSVYAPKQEADPVRDAIKAEMAEKVKAITYGGNWHWQKNEKGEWVRVEDKKKETQTQTTALTNTHTATSSESSTGTNKYESKSFADLYDEVPPWLEDIIVTHDLKECEDMKEYHIIQQIMTAFQVTFEELYECTRYWSTKVIVFPASAEAVAEYAEACAKALDELSERDQKGLALFPKANRGVAVYEDMCKKYNIDYDDLCDVAYTKYKEDIK